MGGFCLFWFFLKAMCRALHRGRALFVWNDCHAAVIPFCLTDVTKRFPLCSVILRKKRTAHLCTSLPFLQSGSNPWGHGPRTTGCVLWSLALGWACSCASHSCLMRLGSERLEARSVPLAPSHVSGFFWAVFAPWQSDLFSWRWPLPLGSADTMCTWSAAFRWVVCESNIHTNAKTQGS